MITNYLDVLKITSINGLTVLITDYLDVPKMTGINTQNDEHKRFNRANY